MRLSQFLPATFLLLVTPFAAPVQAAGKPKPKVPVRPRPAIPQRLAPAPPLDPLPEPNEPYRDDQPKLNTIDVKALTRETQRGSINPGRMTLVWWVPEDYWRASFSQRSDYDEAKSEEFYREMRRYTMVLVVDGRMSDTGQIAYRTEAVTRAGLKIRALDGKDYRPLRAEALGETTTRLIEVTRPLLAQMLGPLGQNMYVYCFPNQNAEGKQLADPRAEGPFSVFLDKREYRWRLPLSSVLPAKKCPLCIETVSGNYKFCPYDGAKLTEAAN